MKKETICTLTLAALGMGAGCKGRNNWDSTLIFPEFGDTIISVGYIDGWGYENRSEEIIMNAQNNEGLRNMHIDSLTPGNSIIVSGNYPVSGTDETKNLLTTYGPPGIYKVDTKVENTHGEIERKLFNRIVGQGETNGDISLQNYLTGPGVVKPLTTNSNEIKALGFFNAIPLITARFDAYCEKGGGTINKFKIHYINSPEDEDYSAHIDDADALNQDLLIIRPGEDIAATINKYLNNLHDDILIFYPIP